VIDAVPRRRLVAATQVNDLSNAMTNEFTKDTALVMRRYHTDELKRSRASLSIEDLRWCRTINAEGDSKYEDVMVRSALLVRVTRSATAGTPPCLARPMLFANADSANPNTFQQTAGSSARSE